VLPGCGAFKDISEIGTGSAQNHPVGLHAVPLRGGDGNVSELLGLSQALKNAGDRAMVVGPFQTQLLHNIIFI